MRNLRQLQVDFIPENFIEKIKNKKLVIVGCGGIGSILSEILIRGGFTNLTLVDFDIVEESNLGRQLFLEGDLNKSKAFVLMERLKSIDPKSRIIIHNTKLEIKNSEEILGKADLIIDATDNFETREIINDYCYLNKKNWIYNGTVKSEITSCIFYYMDNLYGKYFKYKENFKVNENGILPSSTFIAAGLAYNQVIKYFLNVKEYKFIKLNLWTNNFHVINLK